MGDSSVAMKSFVRTIMLDDAPWTWVAGIPDKSTSWYSDMPEFFTPPNAGVVDGKYSSDWTGMYFNIYDELDTSPQAWHITTPTDPTEYQNSWLGKVINIY